MHRRITRTGAAVAGMSLALSAVVVATASGTSAASSPVGSVKAVAATSQAILPAGLRAKQMDTSSAFARQLENKYVDPDRVYSTDVRWWLGEASNTDESLLEEIQALYDAGYRGVELCMQSDAGAADETYAYGSAMWTHKWNLMMNKLLDLGMGVYLTSGTNWATSNVPGLDPTSQQAMQNLTMGTATVSPGQTVTALPAPPQTAQMPGARFVTAYAYKVVQGDTVDPNSYVELKSRIKPGADVWTQNLDWTVPADGTYRIFGMWTQGTFQSSAPSASPSYATNYFDPRGVQALRSFWEQHYLADPALNAKIAKGDVQLFMDSLEIHPGGGSDWNNRVPAAPQFTFWSEDMASEFQKRKGYDITPYLFLIKGVQSFVFDPYHEVQDTGLYKLDGQERRREGIINDYQDVLTQLYRERMLRPLKSWLNSVGIETRAQISYGKPFEMSEPAMDVDYPEAENLNQSDQIDIFRLWTGAAKLENKVLSTETGAAAPPYSTTEQLNMRDVYNQYAAGFQRIVWHVWGAGFSFGNKTWPGHNPTGFRQLGTRHPGYADYDEFNAHLGRVQQLLQTGESRTDVGFINQKWIHGIHKNAGVGNDIKAMNWQLAHQGIYYRSTELQDNGYTYDYFSPKFLFDDDVRFDEGTQTIEKAGYKAVVLYQDWLDFEASKRLLSWAKKGLKVVFLEDAASQTPFNDGKDGALKKVVDELKTLPTVRTATVYDNIDYFRPGAGGYDDNVLEKLQELGVEPYTGFSEPNLQLLTQTRQDPEGNRYVYAYNYGDDDYNKFSYKPSVRNVKFGKEIKTDIVQDGTFVPYAIDSWTGKATELADYQWVDGKTIVPVDVKQWDIALLAFEKVTQPRLHVTDTNAASSRVSDDGLVLRATESGGLTAQLSNGKRVDQSVSVPAPYDIRDWDLTVESWRPSPTPGDLTRTETVDGVTTTNYKSSTVKTDIDVDLDTLTTWDKIPEVGKAVSGKGHYEATFDWDADSATGAYVDFGDDLEESMVVWINGVKVGGHVSTNPTKVRRDVGGVGKATIDDGRGNQTPLVGTDLYTGGINWSTPVADIGDLLVDGTNTIAIDYSSSLSNLQLDRKIVTETPNYKNWWKYAVGYQANGPQQAKIVPYVDVAYPRAGQSGDPTGPTGPTGPGTGPAAPVSTLLDAAVKPRRVVAGRTRAKLKIEATAANASRVDGTLTVKVRGRVITTTVVDGKATVRLPVFARPGNKKVKVFYAATSTHQGSATVVKVRVRAARP